MVRRPGVRGQNRFPPGRITSYNVCYTKLLRVVPQAALGIAEADEPHETFLENALAKARHASRASGLPALADDSGLCVDALGGEPGVHSAHYAGWKGSRAQRDAANNARLLAALETQADRGAHFACVMVLMRHPDDPQPLVAEGNSYNFV